MAKRFTDTEKWKKNFYKNLTPAYKCFWNFITDDCDHSGIWEVEDPQIVALRIGEKIDPNTALYAFNEDEKRIHVFEGGRKWFIIPFVRFQYGILGDANRLHLSVKNALLKKCLYDLAFSEKEQTTPVKGPLQRVKDKDKDKDKDKEIVFSALSDFENIWKQYPNPVGKKQALKHFQATVKTETDFSSCQDALAKYKKHLAVNTWKQPQNGATWFNNWSDWVNWQEPKAVGVGTGAKSALERLEEVRKQYQQKPVHGHHEGKDNLRRETNQNIPGGVG